MDSAEGRRDESSDEMRAQVVLDPKMFKSSIEYLLARIGQVLSEPERTLYTTKRNRFKQIFELINDSKSLRELVSKINANLTQYIERSRAVNIYGSRMQADGSKNQEENLKKQIITNEK